MDNFKGSRERDFYRDTASPNLAVAKALRFSHYPCRPVLKNTKKENRQKITNIFFSNIYQGIKIDNTKKISHTGETESLSVSGSKHFF